MITERYFAAPQWLVPTMSLRKKALVGALLAAAGTAGMAPTAAQAKTKAPYITALRCMPVTLAACKSGVQRSVGDKVILRGKRLATGQRVSFRWSKGALATKLAHNKSGYYARVPSGTAIGTIKVTVTNRAWQRSNKLKLRVVASAPLPSKKDAAASGLPSVFAGNGMWIWYISASEGGNLDAIAAQAKAANMDTVFVKSADGSSTWSQFTPALVAALHVRGLKVCAWQFVYGSNPSGEAKAATASVKAGADCFVIDAETTYEGRYSSAQKYMESLRASVGDAYPIGFTSFPYVDYHPKLPYSVFLGNGGAQANMPQVYWKDIGGSVDAVSAKTVANNRIYGRAIAPLGQTYSAPKAADVRRFRQVWAGYGAGGLSWWDWQETSNALWNVLEEPQPDSYVPPDPGWPVVPKGAAGDQVYWLQQHLVSFAPSLKIDGKYGAPTVAAVTAFQTTRGLPATGLMDAATWQELIKLPLATVDWVK